MKKFRVAIYYHNQFGRNDGSPLYYYNQLMQMPNVEVAHLIPTGDTRNFGKFDLHLWVDYGEDGLPVDSSWLPPEDGGIRAYVASDTHLGQEYRFSKAQHFDHVYFNQQRAVDEYEASERNKLVQWLPHAGEPQAYPAYSIVKKYDVCFIGHLQTMENYNGITRIDALDRLFKEFPNFYYGTRSSLDPSYCLFEDAAKKFAQSKIVFNISIKDDVNMRVFETLSSGSFLLTNELPTLPLLFQDCTHLATYNTLDEMIARAHYYLENDQERELVAKTGHTEFIENHTYRHRLLTVLLEAGYKPVEDNSSMESKEPDMPKGAKPKEDFRKHESTQAARLTADTKDAPSPVDKGKDYVKQGESY